MIGVVDSIDYDGDRVRHVVLRFPPVRSGEAEVLKEVRACERIGQGSFGTVYRAVCDDYPRLALKISTGKSTRLRQELDVLSRVCTKGRLLLPRFEFGALNKAADMIVIGMELCVPSTLHDLLLSTRITSEAEMLFMAYQVVQAVAYVHREGCIHRDIKLQNFVFDLDGNLKLIDFGLACNSLKPPAGDVVAGTVSFMSPEMAHNALHKDKRVSVGVAADVWSLGIVLFSIFTQRNPYPSTETPAAADSGSASRGPENADGADGEKGGAVSQQQRMNERLLRRVAAGDWQWPVGVTVSQDLKQLVNSILVPNPERRSAVEDILANKLWNLRRRYPPAAVTAFLGVQDDVLLSHDEAHLMRAVEERSAGVAASLMRSRLQSPNSTPSGDAESLLPATPQRHQTSGSSSGSAGAGLSRGVQHTAGTTTPPVRGSLKVVQRSGDGGVDGAVDVHVYDVRASTRKRSKPIREISVVMAEETAKTRRSRSARRAKSATTTAAAVSAPVSLAASRAPSSEAEKRRASSAGASLPLRPAAISFDSDEDNAVGPEAAGPSQPPSRAVTPVRLVDALDTDAVSGGPPGHRVEPSCATPPLRAVPAEAAPMQRCGSEELVSVDGAATAAANQPAPSSQLRAATASASRKRDTSLRLASSSILIGVARGGSSAAPSTSGAASFAVLDGAHTALPSSRPPSEKRSVGRARTATHAVPAPAAAPPPQPARKGSPPVMNRAQRIALELSLSVVWQDESDHRRALSSVLLLEHGWLLASFRLTIEEDQERYNITWLAEEQEKSAAHPHLFKEMTRVTSKKYQYGFVCDLCDYEFLPTGRDEKDLHYFHCPCGRDLCPECYAEYQRHCTCSCCRAVHPNSCVLREHLLLTGGTQYHKAVAQETGTSASAAAVVAGSVRGSFKVSAGLDEEGEGGKAALPRRRGRAPKNGATPPSPLKPRGGRAAKDTTRRRRDTPAAALVADDTADEVAQIYLPRMSVAAMQQQERELAGAKAAGRSHRGGATTASPAASASAPHVRRPEVVEVKQRPVAQVPEGPWRPFARFKKDRRDEAARQPTPEERDALLNGEWIRHFYLFPHAEPAVGYGGVSAANGVDAEEEEPYAFVYHVQPGRTGAVFLTSDFPMHSAVFSMLERQFFVVDHVDTVEGADATRATSLLKAKAHPEMKIAFQALQDIVAYDTNMMKQQRTPGTVSVYQAPRSAYSCNGEPFLYVRWFRFNEDRSLSAFLLSNGAVQVFVKNEYELRWFDESRKFIIRYNGVCELVDDGTFALAPAINHLLYDSFDT